MTKDSGESSGQSAACGSSGRTARRVLIVAATVLAAFATVIEHGEAHKAITSKYTYNDDVFPIFRDRCAQCHVENGVAPMSLTTYKDAYPWAESIRAELVAGHMPPWNADEGFGSLKHARTLTARELDVVLTWATGGNPQGNLEQQLPPVRLKNEWALGAPDLALQMPAEFTVPADALEVTQEFTIPTGTTEARSIRAVDLLPGTPKVVRSAVIYLKAPETADRRSAPPPERVLALWVPGHDPEPADGRTVFRLPPGAELGLRIHYKKTWQFEGQAIADRSTIGLYFAPGNEAQELLTLPIALPAANAAGQNETLTFNRTIDTAVQALALRPEQLPPNITVQVQAARPDGSQVPMLRLNTRADWSRRYWLENPVPLPRGSRIEVVANLANPDLLSEAFGPLAPTRKVEPGPIELVVNIVADKASAQN
jgi:mono/diheme cytochrome c family protein